MESLHGDQPARKLGDDFYFRHNYAITIDNERRDKALPAFNGADRGTVAAIFGNNEDFNPSGKYFEDLYNAITHPGIIDVEACFSVGVDIGTDIAKGRAAKTIILDYLNALNSIDQLSYGLVGESNAAGTFIAVRDFILAVVAGKLVDTLYADKAFTDITKPLDTIKAFDDKAYNASWHLSNVAKLKSKYLAYKQAKKTISAYKKETFTEEETRELKDQAIALTRGVMERRKYGTKPAYIGASIGGSWIFYDGDDWLSGLGTTRQDAPNYSDLAAVVLHSNEDSFNDLSFTASSDGTTLTSESKLLREANMVLYIDQTGALSLDAHGLTDIGLELKLPHVKELAFRAEIVANFYDLSMPEMRHRPEDKSFEIPIDRRAKNFSPIQELLVPRIKYFEQLEDFNADEDIVRTIREHDVTWFVRTLPAGCHASPDAVAEAEIHGIELAENETFVKAHTRGSHNRVLGYHAVRRSSNR